MASIPDKWTYQAAFAERDFFCVLISGIDGGGQEPVYVKRGDPIDGKIRDAVKGHSPRYLSLVIIRHGFKAIGAGAGIEMQITDFSIPPDTK